MIAGFLKLALAATAAAHAVAGSEGAAFRAPPKPLSADYVIVGGGTAGCALAARLCEALPRASIVLLERGPPRTPAENDLVLRPRLVGEVWLQPRIAELWNSTPVAGVGGRPLQIITGATLGGSSAVNAGQWTTPGLDEVSGWGFPGFTGAAAAEYYGRAAAQVAPAVPPPSLQQQYLGLWIDAANASGISTAADPLELSAVKPGFVAYTPLAVDAQGRRRDAFTAYLADVMKGACSDNLRVVQPAVAARVEVLGGRATAVTYLKTDEPDGQQERRVEARRGVVSAAGPYGSPKLLQLSGIGPASVLQPLGVPLVRDLPVGQAVQGRVVAPMLDLYTARPLAPEANTSIVFSPEAAARFDRGDGGVLGIGIAALVGSLPEQGCLLGGTGAIGRQFLDMPAILIYGVPNALSRGTLAITSATLRDPAAPPAVDLNLLAVPGEAKAVAGCLNRLQNVTNVIRPDLGLVNILPGAPKVSEDALRMTANNSYHFAAGCSVGEVVDGEFRVLGLKGLRVVDASVIPKLPDGSGLMASVYALAEHAADLIIAEHPKDRLSRGGESRRQNRAHRGRHCRGCADESRRQSD